MEDAYQLSAILKITKGNGDNARGGRSKSNAGGSVTAKPIPPNYSSTDSATNGRICHIEWEHLLGLPGNTPSSGTRHLLSVATDTGVRGGTGKFSKIKILEKYISFSSNMFILQLTLQKKMSKKNIWNPSVLRPQRSISG